MLLVFRLLLMCLVNAHKKITDAKKATRSTLAILKKRDGKFLHLNWNKKQLQFLLVTRITLIKHFEVVNTRFH